MPKKATKKVDQIDKKKGALDKVKPSLYQSADYIMNLERILIPWSPGFDEILGGGICSGSLTLISGKAKSGKTSSFLQFAASAQKPQYGGRYWNKVAAEKRSDKPGRPVFFYNIENRLTKRDLNGIPGLNLDPDKFKLITTTDTNTLYLEDYFENIEETMNLYPGCIIIIDSIGALCTKKVGAATHDGQVQDPAPLLSSYFMKRIGPLVMAKDIIMLNVLHKVTNVRAQQNQSKTLVTGGTKLRYGANNIIDITYSEIETDSDGKPTGSYILHLKDETSELGPPGVTADAYLKFGQGLWEGYELLLLATASDVNGLFSIRKNSAWYQFEPEITGGEQVKIQGTANAAQYLSDNPKVYQSLYKAYSTACWSNAALYKSK